MKYNKFLFKILFVSLIAFVFSGSNINFSISSINVSINSISLTQKTYLYAQEHEAITSKYYSNDDFFPKDFYKNTSNDISTILNKNLKGLIKTKYSIAIYSSKLNDWIYTYNYKQLLVPASNMKLVTTFTTYYQLGDKYQISTSIVTDGKIENGILHGNLYIVGGGDALLSIPDLEVIAAEIKNLGINKINGNIYGDGSFFDKISNRFFYSNDKDEVEPVAPITALAIEQNTVNVIVTSGSIAGKYVNVQFKPASSAFTVSNTAVVGAGGNTKKNPKAKKTKKVINSISITTSVANNGKQVFYVSGALAPNRTYTYKYFINKPALVVAGILKDRLFAEGVTVTGDIEEKECPKNEKHQTTNLYTFTRNINDIIAITNKNSDNYLAETLFKLNSAVNRKEENSAKYSSYLLMQTLANNNINHIGFVFNDGSGLSRRNLISTEALVQLLIQARNKKFAQSFESSLSIAGIDGTLRKRMLNSYAQNNLKGKTGTHKDVSALSGFLENRSGDTLYFSFIFNGKNVGTYKGIENQICMKLAEY